MWLCAYEYRCPWKPEVLNLPELELKVISCEHPDMGAGSQTHDLWKIRESSWSLCHVCRPPKGLGIYQPPKNIYLLNKYLNIFLNFKTLDIPKFF